MSWAAVAGAAVGVVGSQIGNKQSGSSVSTQSNAPWEGLQPYLQDLMWRSQGASNNQSPLTAQSQNMIANRATAGSPLTGASSDALLKTIQGDYLDPTTNPVWGPMSGRIADAYSTGTAAQTDAAFNRAGAYGVGNSAYEETVGRNQQSLGDSLSLLAGNIYNQERGKQMTGIGMAPGIAQADYADADRLGAVGQEQTWGPLFNYQKLISGQGGGTSTTSSPLYNNPLNAALGGAMVGNQMFGGSGGATNNQFGDWGNMGSSTPFFGGYGWGNT